jgi:deoxyadenosine/deoxycytidine kinase
VIVIDGVVGAGKSTLAKKLSEKLNIPIYFELQNQTSYRPIQKNGW